MQIMSMGSGLCMPPMMFPTGMQHMHPAHVPHFQPMGVGVGMGMGMAFGMGMPDMNGASSGCPIYPVPPLQVPHFPSPVPGLPNFQRMPGHNLPVFGHPGQAFPNSVPRPPFVPLAPRPPVTSAMGSSTLRNGSNSEIPSTPQIMKSGVPVTAMNPQSMCNAEARSSVPNKSNQVCFLPFWRQEVFGFSHIFVGRNEKLMEFEKENSGNYLLVICVHCIKIGYVYVTFGLLCVAFLGLCLVGCNMNLYQTGKHLIYL